VAGAERWSRQELADHQLQRLRDIVRLAYERSPWYRAAIQAAGVDPGLPGGVLDFERLPLIDKQTINARAGELMVVRGTARGLDYVSTGGSSGEPFRFLIGVDRSAAEFAHLTAGWARVGYSLRAPQAVFRGQLVEPNLRGLRHSYDPLLRRHHYSSFHMDDDSVGAYLEHVATIGPCYLLAYPSSANTLVRYLRRTKTAPPANVKGVLAGSENVYPQDRRAAEKVLGVRYYSWYGHSEKLVMAAECERSSTYHVFPTYGYCELIDERGRRITRRGERGEIVGTGFINRVMPFIRYRTGDQATYAGDHCPECGRAQMLLADIRGHRTLEVLVAKDGSLVPWVAVNMHDDTYEGVRQFQFVQSELGRATLRVVPAGRPGDLDIRRIREQLGARLAGRVEFDVKIVDEIALTSRGKMIYVDQQIDLTRHGRDGNDEQDAPYDPGASREPAGAGSASG